MIQRSYLFLLFAVCVVLGLARFAANGGVAKTHRLQISFSVRNYTLPVGIALYQSSYYTEYGLTLATSALATAPLILVFLIFQKQIVESMASTGLKD